MVNKRRTEDNNAIYLLENKEDIRSPFFRDIDRIIYSLSYVRYMDKTQVFTFEENDHLQKRMIHVQYVSKIARTIGRALGLNEDLIEAASLGHDIGHPPFGHVGENILNEISLSQSEGIFLHNINSIRQLVFLENHGKGINLSMQVFDAIMCHNGEIVTNEIYPKKKTVEEFWNEYFDSYKDINTAKYLRPMTLEGCVVRVSDIIAYIGRDIEDAIRLGLITWGDVPLKAKSVLGFSNSEIVNTLVRDVIENSMNKDYIAFSENVYQALKLLKNFNSENIYKYAYTSEERIKIKNMFSSLINHYLKDLKEKNMESSIYKNYLNEMCDSYLKNTNERIVLDYVSGMTDNYFLKEYYTLIKENR